MKSQTKTAIGMIKVKAIVYCEICGCNHTRVIKINIFKNTTEEIENAKKLATKRINNKYTCNICKSILRSC